MLMPGPPRPPAPSSAPWTAPLPKASSLANSAATTAPPRSVRPCCAPLTQLPGLLPTAVRDPSQLRPFDHDFTTPHYMMLGNIAFFRVGTYPTTSPISAVGPFVVDANCGAWFAMGSFPRNSGCL